MVVSGSAASLVPSYKELQLYAFVCFGIQWLSSLYAVPKQTEHFLDVTGSFTNRVWREQGVRRDPCEPAAVLLGLEHPGLLTVLPVLALAHGAHNPEMSPFDVAGSSLWVLGYLMEMTADYQKTQFRRNEAKKGKFTQSGLWFYSRHPNYCGEIMISSQRSSATRHQEEKEHGKRRADCSSKLQSNRR
ncbi:hypothetical protein PRNP1_004473 [Phytophthora ramorum]